MMRSKGVEIRKRNALEPQASLRVHLKLRAGMKLLGFNVEALIKKTHLRQNIAHLFRVVLLRFALFRFVTFRFVTFRFVTLLFPCFRPRIRRATDVATGSDSV